MAEGLRPENRVEVTAQERSTLTEWFQKELARRDQPIVAVVDLGEGKTLRMELFRQGRAAAAVWSNQTEGTAEWTPVAVSAVLFGEAGADDVAAVEWLRRHEPPLPFAAPYVNKILAAERPCVAAVYNDAEWLRNGRIELVAMSSALAHLAAPGESPTLEFQTPATPEDTAEVERRANRVARVYQIIHNDWSTRNRLRYAVKPTEKVMGRPVSEIRHVKFWVGVDGKGGDQLDLDETVAVFELLSDQAEQLPGSKYLKDKTVTSTITVRRHDPATIARVLGSLRIDEPPDGKTKRKKKRRK